jgi:hypothetical protein
MSNPTFKPNKIATPEAAAAVDHDPPLQKLLEAVKNGVSKPAKGECVVYWMRLEDLRSTLSWHNNALFSRTFRLQSLTTGLFPWHPRKRKKTRYR